MHNTPSHVGIRPTIHTSLLRIPIWKASLSNLEDEYGNKLHHDTTRNMENTCEAASLKKKRHSHPLKTTKKLKRIMTQIKQNNNGGKTQLSALLFHSSNIHVVC